MAVSGRKAHRNISSIDSLGSDGGFDVFCRPCERDGENISAFGFCTDCNEHLCQSCFCHHKKATPSRSHVLLRKDEVVSQHHRLSTIQEDPQEEFTKPCQKHAKERIRFYCHRHSSLICGMCMLEHRYCVINYIPEISGNIADSYEYRDIIEEITALIDDSRMVSEEAKKTAGFSKQCLSETLKEFQKFKEEIEKRTNELEKDIEEMVKTEQQDNNKMAEDTEEICEKVIRNLEGQHQQLTMLHSLKQSNKLFIELKEASQQLQRCKDEISGTAGNISSSKLLFLPNDSLSAMIRNKTHFGELVVSKDRASVKGKCIGDICQLSVSNVNIVDPSDLRADQIKLHDLFDDKKTGVLKGICTTGDNQRIDVAVRKAEHDSSEDVLHEAQLMFRIRHKNIIKMIGLCKSSNVMLVLELSPLGSLNTYLRAHRETTQANIVELMWQVAMAMEYLEEKRIVHRNLAARNVLLMSEHYAKVTDFRMAVQIDPREEFYESGEAGRWPLKWYAPECIYFWQFDSASDVWSYGVTLWEATSYGMRPYLKMKGQEILQFLVDHGKRLAKPEHCEEDVYSLMLQCWKYDKTERPTFKEITTSMFSLYRRMSRK